MPATSARRLVALDQPPGDAFVRALESAWADGNAVLPVDPSLPAAARQQLDEALRPAQPVDPDVALVIATSGSTGAPKGAQLTAAALAASADATVARLELDAGDCWLACLPWHHIGGLQVLLRARRAGSRLVVHERFDVGRFAAERVPTVTSLVPTQLLRLLDAGVGLRHYKAILLGGAAPTPGLLDRAAAAGARVVSTYGMSETAGGCVYDGFPLDGVRVRIDPTGRIEIAGPTLMTGYRLRPDLTGEVLAGGWLRTSDRGHWDGDGRLVVDGRIDDIVVTGGENVDVAYVGAVVSGHPAIADVAVSGVADDEWGQRVVAVVVLASPLDLAALRRWCADRLPPAAVPRGLVVVDRLPLLANGKPDRLALRRLAARAVD